MDPSAIDYKKVVAFLDAFEFELTHRIGAGYRYCKSFGVPCGRLVVVVDEKLSIAHGIHASQSLKLKGTQRSSHHSTVQTSDLVKVTSRPSACWSLCSKYQQQK